MASEPGWEGGETAVEEDRAAALLHTLALFKANYDDGRDYLTNFEPYVADVLKDWRPGEPVKPQALRNALEDRFAIPPMPINTAEIMRGRAVQHDWIRRDSSRDFFPNRRTLNSVKEVRTGAKTVLGHVDWLIESFRVHARNEHELDWSPPEASGALERFVEEFSFELALAKRNRGDLTASVPDVRALTVASSFVRRAFSAGDVQTMNYLEEMVQGSMLANVLYFHELGSWSESLPTVTVYLDTAVALRALDLTLEPLAEATKEMMDMLQALKVNVRVFEHTVDEMHRILVSASSAMRKGELSVSPKNAGHKPNREVSDAALMRNWTAADLDEAAASLHTELRRHKIQAVDSPKVPERAEITASRLRSLLGERISYPTLGPLEKDVQSVMATHVFRRGHECRTLARTPAIFVTANSKLAQVTHEFFEEDVESAGIPHVTTDVSLTNQLWVRSPIKHRNVPRRLLIAESFAALSGNSTAWDRYLSVIERQRDRGRIDARLVKTLVGEMESRESFLQVTLGEANSVDEGTPMQVLNRLDDRETESGETGKRSSDDGAEGGLREDVDRQTDEIATQKEALVHQQEVTSTLEAWKVAHEAADLQRRQVQGVCGAAGAVGLAVALVWAGAVEGGLGIALATSLLLAVAVGSASWGFRKGWGWGVKAFIAAGAVLAFPVAMFTLVGGDGDSKPDPQPPAKERSAAGQQRDDSKSESEVSGAG